MLCGGLPCRACCGACPAGRRGRRVCQRAAAGRMARRTLRGSAQPSNAAAKPAGPWVGRQAASPAAPTLPQTAHDCPKLQVLNSKSVFDDAESRHKKGEPQLITMMVSGWVGGWVGGWGLAAADALLALLLPLPPARTATPLPLCSPVALFPCQGDAPGVQPAPITPPQPTCSCFIPLLMLHYPVAGRQDGARDPRLPLRPGRCRRQVRPAGRHQVPREPAPRPACCRRRPAYTSAAPTLPQHCPLLPTCRCSPAAAHLSLPTCCCPPVAAPTELREITLLFFLHTLSQIMSIADPNNPYDSGEAGNPDPDKLAVSVPPPPTHPPPGGVGPPYPPNPQPTPPPPHPTHTPPPHTHAHSTCSPSHRTTFPAGAPLQRPLVLQQVGLAVAQGSGACRQVVSARSGAASHPLSDLGAPFRPTHPPSPPPPPLLCPPLPLLPPSKYNNLKAKQFALANVPFSWVSTRGPSIVDNIPW